MQEYVIKWDIFGAKAEGWEPVSPEPIKAESLDEAFEEAEQIVRSHMATVCAEHGYEGLEVEITLRYEGEDGEIMEHEFSFSQDEEDEDQEDEEDDVDGYEDEANGRYQDD